MRVLCVLLPHFPFGCEEARNPALQHHATIVTSETGSQKLVLDCSPELEDLTAGMPLQQALSRYGEAGLVQADVPYYWSVFNGILDALEEKSPIVEGTELGCAYIGVDGIEGIYPDDAALVKAIYEAISPVFTAHLGIAEGKFPAFLAASYSPADSYRALSGDLVDFLNELPCTILPVSNEAKNKLHEFGFQTLGQLVSLPVGPILSQFGLEGERILELARGCDDTPLHPRFLEEIIEESDTLASVTTTMEALVFAVETLLERVFSANRLKGRGISSMMLWTRTWNAVNWERKIQFKEPAMNLKTAMRRVKQTLENYPQPGPVEQIGVKLTHFSYGTGRQKNIFADVRAKAHLLEDIKQLELKLGSPQVFKVTEVEPWSRIPERRYALRPVNQ